MPARSLVATSRLERLGAERTAIEQLRQKVASRRVQSATDQKPHGKSSHACEPWGKHTNESPSKVGAAIHAPAQGFTLVSVVIN